MSKKPAVFWKMKTFQNCGRNEVATPEIDPQIIYTKDTHRHAL